MDNTLNILYLINYAGKAGTEKYVENLVRLFSDGRARCHFAWNLDGELLEKMRARGIPCFKLEMRSPLDLKAAKALAAYCRENKIDVIHAQFPRENFIAILSKRRYSAPRVVYTNHLTLETGFVWRLMNRFFTPKNHRIIAVCGAGRDIMVKNGVAADKICVIHNGVEPIQPVRDLSAREELGVCSDEFMMTILARLSPEKGLLFLLSALSELKALTSRPFRCVICGDGEQADELTSRRDELGLTREVIFAGFVRDTASVLAASDLYLNSSEHSEALSFAVLEAMNAGNPVVVTDVGGNAELARDGIVCGRVVPYGDKRAFAEAILEIMENDALRQELSHNASKKVRTSFDLAKLADEVYKTYLIKENQSDD